MIPLHGIQVSLDGIDAVFVDLCFNAMRPLAQLAAGSEGGAVRSTGPFSPKELPYLLLQPCWSHNCESHTCTVKLTHGLPVS